MNAFIARSGVRVVPLTWRRRLLYTLAFWGVGLLLAWLDSSRSGLSLQLPHAVHTSSVFTFILDGLEILAGWVATAAEVTAEYVWIALQWLGGTVSTFLKSTGAMFAKVWDGVQIVWADALKPALQWIDDTFTRFYGWLKSTFKPVFDFLEDVRQRLYDFYGTFVRPVVATIDFIRQVNTVLLAFHIDLLQSLDKYLQQLEQRIEEPFLWLNKQINVIWNALDLIVTADGLFQRLTLLKSMSRDAPLWMRMSTNARTKPLNDDQAYAIVRANETPDLPAVIDDLQTYYNGGDVNIGEVIDQATERARDYYEAA